MLPRPATIAAPPSTASPVSWNPAVPPPPVTGAPLGTGLGDGLGDGLAEGLGLGDADGLGEELALTLVDVLAEVVATVPVTVTVTVTPSLTVGDRVITGGVEGLEVHAESATQASMVVRPQPTTVSRTRCDVHSMAVRALIEPPRVLGNDHFPVAGRRNEENVGDLSVRPKR